MKRVLFVLLVLGLSFGPNVIPARATQDGLVEPKPVAVVTGGGIATFDDDLFFGPPPAEETVFGMGVTIYPGGNATGHFECLVPGVLTINGDVTSGTVKSDGTVTFSGSGRVHCHPAVEAEFPEGCADVGFFQVIVDGKGGPGKGHFIYLDSFLISIGDPGDPETVRVGQIKIRTP